MKIDEIIKIDIWWKAVLCIGVALCACVLIFNIDILNRKHLLGLGIGLVMIGISMFMASKILVHREYNAIYQIPITRHNLI